MKLSRGFPRQSKRVIALAVTTAVFLIHPISAAADYASGVRYYNKGNYGKALKAFMKEAEKGNPDARQALGLMYEKGRGVMADPKEAVRWYTLAADQGHDLAAVNLGILYRDGTGVERDYNRAMHYLTIGAMQDDPTGQNALGAMFANGQGVPSNDMEAFAWFLLADDNGSELARQNLDLLKKRMTEQQIEIAYERQGAILEKIAQGDLNPGAPAVETRVAATSAQSGSTPRKAASSEGWVAYSDDHGISFRHPAGWRVRQGVEGAVGISDRSGGTLILWPFFTTGTLTASASKTLIASLTARLEPAARLTPAITVQTQAVKATGRWNLREFAAGLAWTASSKGSPGLYTLASAPEGALRRLLPDFAAIASSLDVKGKGTGRSAGKTEQKSSVAFQQWRDPTENAFTLDVPRDWEVTGGIARFNAVDVRPYLKAISPERTTTVFIGDASIPSFLTPHPSLTQSGFPEGSVYQAGYNQRFLIKRYLQGEVMARAYYDGSVGRNCSSPTVMAYRALPETTREINAIFQRYGLPFVIQRLDAGEVAMACRASGRAGYVFAGTFLTEMDTYQGRFGMWVLNFLYGYDAPETDTDRAGEVLERMTESLSMNPEWLRMNTQNAGAVSKIVSETGQAIARTVSSGYWNKVRSDDRLSVSRSQTLLEIENTYDPVTGRNIEVKSGSDYYWIDAKGNVVGTQTDTLPQVDFRKLFSTGG